jgi:hypothetical protein
MVLHDFVFKVRVPKRLPGWLNRESLVRRLSVGTRPRFSNFVSWQVLKRKGQISMCQNVCFQGYKFLLYDSWIVLHLSKSFVGSEYDSMSLAAELFTRDLLRSFFRALHLFLGPGRSFPVEWTRRQHYARMNDPVARDFRRNKQKVRVPFLDYGFFVFDFSDHVDHAELQNRGEGDFLDSSWKPFIQDWQANHPGLTFSKLLLVDASVRVRVKRLEDRVFFD